MFLACVFPSREEQREGPGTHRTAGIHPDVRCACRATAEGREECRYVLETLGGVYHHDALPRERKLSPEDRLHFHQEHSGPLMRGLHAWMGPQMGGHQTEPNSGLGKAISHLRHHWSKPTLFLRQPGPPIDNNIVNAARGICGVMPTPGLCRVRGLLSLPAVVSMLPDAA